MNGMRILKSFFNASYAMGQPLGRITPSTADSIQTKGVPRLKISLSSKIFLLAVTLAIIQGILYVMKIITKKLANTAWGCAMILFIIGIGVWIAESSVEGCITGED